MVFRKLIVRTSSNFISGDYHAKNVSRIHYSETADSLRRGSAASWTRSWRRELNRKVRPQSGDARFGGIRPTKLLRLSTELSSRTRLDVSSRYSLKPRREGISRKVRDTTDAASQKHAVTSFAKELGESGSHATLPIQIQNLNFRVESRFNKQKHATLMNAGKESIANIEDHTKNFATSRDSCWLPNKTSCGPMSGHASAILIGGVSGGQARRRIQIARASPSRRRRLRSSAGTCCGSLGG